MNREVLGKRIEELEVMIKETDESIQKGFEASEFMVEPIKTQFVNQLKLRKLQLEGRKGILESFKKMQ